jgi:hypothetical protein
MRWRCTNLLAVVSAFVALGPWARGASADDPLTLLQAESSQRGRWATEWLTSDDPRRIAWGAWLARQDNRIDLVPILLDKIRGYQVHAPAARERDQHDELLAVLDAVISLRANVPADDARKLYPEFAAQAIIVLVRSPDGSQDALLEIFRDAKANWNWLAAGNALANARTAGFAAVLLDRLTQHLTVSVFDPGQGAGGGIGGGGSECGFSAAAPKSGWPSIGLYQLTQYPERMPWLTAAFLVGGRTPVYYWRSAPGNYDNPTGDPGTCDDGNRDVYRTEYLNQLLGGVFPPIVLEAYPHASIVWSGATTYQQQINAVLEQRRNLFRSATAFLQMNAQMLTAAEVAPLRSRIEVIIQDERFNKTIPLPALEGRDVLLTSAFAKPEK